MSRLMAFLYEEKVNHVKRLLTLTAIAALAVSLGTACSKAQMESNGPGAGPITDSGDTGLKPVAGAVADAADPKHGQLVFSTNCASCHGAGGVGGFGPKLIGEKAKKDQAAAVAWIKNPAPPMTKLYPAPLGDRDVADVAAYVESL